ncbi:hypothetical protein Tco_1351553 [Tanacetum coccineum]|uniref:Uncharacterized protein n=1 Tax=Tanacetum coccineum TaxID=301880 RepID=A0ABQ4ZD81_9ASTR
MRGPDAIVCGRGSGGDLLNMRESVVDESDVTRIFRDGSEQMKRGFDKLAMTILVYTPYSIRVALALLSYARDPSVRRTEFDRGEIEGGGERDCGDWRD